VIPGTGPCDPTNPTPARNLAVWGTHLAPGVNRLSAVNAAVVETQAEDLSLSGGEETELASLCSMIVANDSGFGICSCTGEVTDTARKIARK